MTPIIQIVAMVAVIGGVLLLYFSPTPAAKESAHEASPDDGRSQDDGLSQGAIDRAALREINERYGLGNIYSSIGNSPAECDAYEKKLQAVREYRGTLKDKRWQSAYDTWIDYFTTKLAQSRRAWAENQEVARAKQAGSR